MRVTLDTNILVYALQADDARHGPAQDIVARAIAGDCVQTLQSFAECFNALVRRRRILPDLARDKLERLRARLPVQAASHADLDRAMWAVAHHRLAFWDAMLWATACRAGCRLILTEDLPGLPELDGVMFRDPFDPANDDLIKRALPPLEA